jgi:hypothetical protein
MENNARALRSAEIQLIVLEAKLAVGPFAEEISVLQEKGNITNTSQIFFQLHIFIRLVSVVDGFYLNLDYVTSNFSLSLDHRRFSSSL